MPVRLCYDPRFIHAEEWDDAMLLNEVHARKDAIAALGRQFGARRIRVFGSVARGEEQPGSDIAFWSISRVAMTSSPSACHWPNTWLTCSSTRWTWCRSMS